MKINFNMKSLLKEHLIDIDCVSQNNAYPIWHKTDTSGSMYWGVASFLGMEKSPTCEAQNLSQLEWDGNEVCLDAHTDEAVANMLKSAIGILLYWKSELKTRYSDTSFYLFATYDNGDMLILEDGASPVKSMTMRFWADRGENTVINLEDFEDWDQPAILEHIKRNPLH